MSGLQGIVHDLDEATYHAHHALSATGAKRLLDSPARFRWETDNRVNKRSFDVGHAVHAKVLGVGSPVIGLDFDSYRTKAAQEARDAAYAGGLVPMLVKDMEPINAAAESVLAHPTARQLFEQDGTPETSLFATVDGVECRARFDYFAPINVDLKTTSGRADVHGFAQSSFKFGYDVQQEFYGDVLEAVAGERRPFVFVMVEMDAPFLVGVHQLDRDAAGIGRGKARRARQVFAECTASGKWPGYPAEIQLVAPPMWAVYEAQDKGYDQ
ncbi:MAG TPA: PD-(D/E)XK nuclease-like domain-containing protein [Candidatus Lumbricidophila sp.]|nr:PD-(D/E)XK nuclease-like domain-containing protein [Candidatus Lumbricidophila sp.]